MTKYQYSSAKQIKFIFISTLAGEKILRAKRWMTSKRFIMISLLFCIIFLCNNDTQVRRLSLVSDLVHQTWIYIWFVMDLLLVFYIVVEKGRPLHKAEPFQGSHHLFFINLSEQEDLTPKLVSTGVLVQSNFTNWI